MLQKTLLAIICIASGCFFSYAQFKVGDVNVNLGKVCTTSKSGTVTCVNPSQGQYQMVDNNGRTVQYNANTGAMNVSGTLNGVPINVGVAGANGSQYTNANLSGPLRILALLQTIVTVLVPFLVGLALLAFFWFLIEFIWKGRESSDVQSKAKAGMIWSIVALFVMVSIWGIIAFMGGVFGIRQGGTINGFVLPGSAQ